jgi:hypothetical protein
LLVFFSQNLMVMFSPRRYSVLSSCMESWRGGEVIVTRGPGGEGNDAK